MLRSEVIRETREMMVGRIFAHRGLHGKYDDLSSISIPENSPKAFELAIRKKYPIEIDLHILTDGTVVVFHDSNLKRMTGLDRRIREMSWDEVKKLMLFDRDGEPVRGQHIMKFDGDFFEMMRGQFLLIELKYDVTDHSLEKKVMNTLMRYGQKLSGYLLQSFDPRIVRYLNRHGYPCGLLMSPGEKGSYLFNMILNIEVVRRWCKPTFLSVDHRMLLDPRVQHFRRKHGPVASYLVKSKTQFNRLKKYADALICEGFLDQIDYATSFEPTEASGDGK